jgi:hypothetical protein
VTKWRQPWELVRIEGKRCHLQVLDPKTAFEFEHDIAGQLGDAAAMLMAAPAEVVKRVVADAKARRAPVLGEYDESLETLQRWMLTVAHAMVGMRPDPTWMVSAWSRLVLGRLKVDGALIEDVVDWQGTRFSWRAKWAVLVAQLRQTYAPLWTRSPYKVRVPDDGLNVPAPTDVPMAVQWADALAVQGHATSAQEVLLEWTPVDVIHAVENAAFRAARERLAYERARRDGK